MDFQLDIYAKNFQRAKRNYQESNRFKEEDKRLYFIKGYSKE